METGRDVLRAAAWIIALLVPTAATLWPYYKQSNKDLRYLIVSATPLVPLEAAEFKGLTLYKDGVLLDRPYLATLRIRNAGDIPIQVTDFHSSITIRAHKAVLHTKNGRTLSGKALEELTAVDPALRRLVGDIAGPSAPKFADARIAWTKPENIPTRLSVSGDTVELSPTLLNPLDEIGIELIIVGGVPVITVDARVAGIARMLRDEISGKESSFPISKGPGWFFLLAAMIATALSAAVRVTSLHLQQLGVKSLLSQRWIGSLLFLGSAFPISVLAALSVVALRLGTWASFGVLMVLLIGVFVPIRYGFERVVMRPKGRARIT